MRTSRLLAPLVVAATLVGAGPAQASDATVRRAVAAQEKLVVAAEKAFAAGTDDTFSAVGREDARLVTVRLTSVLARAKGTVTKQTATSSALKRARVRYLTAVQGGLTGVKTFARGLAAFDPDAPAKSAALVKQGRAQLKGATTRRVREAKAVRASA